SEAAALAGQARVQVAADDAGLHAHGVGPHVEDGAEVPAEIDDQAGAERLAGDAAAGAARDQRDAALAGVADQGAHVVFVARRDGAERLDLKDAGVGAVEGAREVVEEEVPLDESLEVVANALALRLVHGNRPRLAASVARALFVSARG